MLTTTVPALRVKGVSRRFGAAKALDELSFSIAPNQVVGLLGRNGAGKSTLLRIVSGQLRPSSGEVFLFDQPRLGATASLGKLCMVGDTPDFGKLNNVGQLYYVCAGLFPKWNQEYALRLAGRFELPMKKALKSFSRGMQTALLLSVGLASGADLTIFDEPSLGLDAVMRERFYDLLLEERRKESGRTFVVSTHLIDEVARALDSAVLMDRGRLLTEGEIKEITALYISISGAPEAVREASEGMEVLREEEMAGSLVRHLRLSSPEEAQRLRDDGRIQSATMSLQRLFVFLTEEREAGKHAANA